MNLSELQPMTDHFEGIDKLVKEAPHTEGAPNFRRVSPLKNISTISKLVNQAKLILGLFRCLVSQCLVLGNPLQLVLKNVWSPF